MDDEPTPTRSDYTPISREGGARSGNSAGAQRQHHKLHGSPSPKSNGASKRQSKAAAPSVPPVSVAQRSGGAEDRRLPIGSTVRRLQVCRVF